MLGQQNKNVSKLLLHDDGAWKEYARVMINHLMLVSLYSVLGDTVYLGLLVKCPKKLNRNARALIPFLDCLLNDQSAFCSVGPPGGSLDRYSIFRKFLRVARPSSIEGLWKHCFATTTYDLF